MSTTKNTFAKELTACNNDFFKSLIDIFLRTKEVLQIRRKDTMEIGYLAEFDKDVSIFVFFGDMPRALVTKNNSTVLKFKEKDVTPTTFGVYRDMIYAATDR